MASIEVFGLSKTPIHQPTLDASDHGFAPLRWFDFDAASLVSLFRRIIRLLCKPRVPIWFLLDRFG